jgi:hypothetical protein
MNTKKLFFVAIIFIFANVFCVPTFTIAASDSDIDKLTTYAVILGRAIGCGINTDYEMRRVGAWMDKKFPPGSSDQKTYLPIFLQGIQYHAKQQSSGNSPDSCPQVRKSFKRMQWP